MRKRWIYVTQIALSVVVISGLATGCGVLSSIPAPPTSEYPADISGRVTIAEKVIAKYNRNKPDTMELTPLERKVFWIVDISVKNKSYEDVVTASYKDWKIVAGDKVYDSPKPFMDIWPSTAMNVVVGATGKTTFRFTVPDTLKVSSAKLCYQGQEPYSCGKLTGGDKVAVYNWDLGVARVESAVAHVVGKPYVGVLTLDLRFELEPTDLAVAGKVYEVELYEKGKFRSVTSISWSQPELNVKKVKSVGFPLSYEERQAYFLEDISHIFSLKMCEWRKLGE